MCFSKSKQRHKKKIQRCSAAIKSNKRFGSLSEVCAHQAQARQKWKNQKWKKRWSLIPESVEFCKSPINLSDNRNLFYSVCLCVSVCERTGFSERLLSTLFGIFSSRHTFPLPDEVRLQATAWGKLLTIIIIKTMNGLKQSDFLSKVWMISRCSRVVYRCTSLMEHCVSDKRNQQMEESEERSHRIQIKHYFCRNQQSQFVKAIE